jgi:organic radical activating enzyme
MLGGMNPAIDATPLPKAVADGLTLNEIFYSIQGESTFAGEPCVFVRLTGCDLRCTYCDTEYAFYEGKKRSIDSIVEEVGNRSCRSGCIFSWRGCAISVTPC